jgi:NADH-quinone oxidoreductase subunit J
MIFPVHEIIFYVFTAVLIASATAMITSKNPVRAVLLLVVSFFASAVLWMLMQAEFLALVLIFVYVGAVMTLFLFVVMMLRIESAPVKSFVRYYPLAVVAFLILVGTAFYAFSAPHWAASTTLPTHYPQTYNNVVVMGTLLFTQYVFAFEIAAVLLLVGMVSAIALAFHGRKAGTRSQSISEQLAATKADRLRIVDLQEPRS